MRAVDTNVLVRLLTRDDEEQTTAAEALVAPGAWVSLVVLVETIWVLESVYDVDAGARAKAVEMLLNHRELTVQDPDVVERALGHFRRRPSLGFSDCLVLEAARKAGHGPLGTLARSTGRSFWAEAGRPEDRLIRSSSRAVAKDAGGTLRRRAGCRKLRAGGPTRLQRRRGIDCGANPFSLSPPPFRPWRSSPAAAAAGAPTRLRRKLQRACGRVVPQEGDDPYGRRRASSSQRAGASSTCWLAQFADSGLAGLLP
jgi:predicted nucleic-acid-binding protein